MGALGLEELNDGFFILSINMLLMTYAASPSEDNVIKSSSLIQFLVVSITSAMAASRMPVVAVMLMMSFFCVTA